ncbi:MAG: ABC transporter ATP-binding protein [Chloroflexi bacterium]|uniref:ABC transporter ATP-binding protein n=1 Tax=Candidatus Chlorohelix allophototropha TaxID=3003348 RepID=A0A8T7M0P7_9CHLR|nr:ABC transporter ATP-binding protein [Chloroflexota bacterium]WJW67382.1 ABC transporter ATP-binding protein [Chloroflexota bacterium L227-S17]
MLKLSNLTVGYKRTTVLSGFNLEIANGEIVAVLGRNGAGKSTLLRAIAGTLPMQSGIITFDDKDISHKHAHERAQMGIAYVPQGREIFPNLTVLENLKVAGYASRQPNLNLKLEETFSEFPVLAEKRNLRGGSLSGGQQQILALARALLTNPKLLLLDEPTEGVQPSIVDQIAEIIRRINTEKNITVLLVEQNLDFAVHLALRAILVDKGQVKREIPAEAILNDQDLQREYLGI